MPRPNKGRTIGAEERMRANVLRLLEEQERTPSWLARKMAEQGWPGSASAIYKSLNGDRTLYVDDAVFMAVVLGATVTDLCREVSP